MKIHLINAFLTFIHHRAQDVVETLYYTSRRPSTISRRCIDVLKTTSIKRRTGDVVTLVIKRHCNEDVRRTLIYFWWNDVINKTLEKSRCIVDKTTLKLRRQNNAAVLLTKQLYNIKKSDQYFKTVDKLTLHLKFWNIQGNVVPLLTK